MESQTRMSITVHFVHRKLKSLDIDLTDGLSCQDVIKICFNHIARLICEIRNDTEIYAPKYLHTFGLSVYPDQKMWVSPNHLFDGNKEKGKTFQFRVRFYPHPENINYESSSKEAPVMLEYLYLQILNDFLFGKLGESTKFDNKKVFRLLTIALLMPSTLPFDSSLIVNEQYQEQRVNVVNLKNKMSKALSKRLITHWLIDTFWICQGLREVIDKLKSLNKSLGYHKQMFFKELMDVEPYYWIEQYTVTYNESESKKFEVTLTVNFSELNHLPTLFFGEVSKFGLADINELKIHWFNLNVSSRNVLIFPQNQAVMSLEFPDQVSAESFVSMLQGFFMLFVCYDVCLSSELQTPDMKIRNELQSFGPLQESSAKEILESLEPNSNSSSQYVIFESLTQHDHYKAMVSKGGSIETLDIEIQKMNIINLLKNGTLLQRFDRCRTLTNNLRNEYTTQILPRNYPGEAEINKMFQVNKIDHYYQDSGPLSSLNAEPGIFLREDLEEKSLIADKNPLIRKYKVALKSKTMMLVELQAGESAIAEGFRGGIQDIFKLHRLKPESFIKFYGSVWERKLCVLMEYAPFGDLLTYICQNPQTVSQKVNLMYQIVNILGFLETQKIFHGNIRSRKFMVFGAGNTFEKNIKLGDSGISHYLDTLPLNEPHNIDRLPWLSPERRRNIASITYESECYAVGTTLCEIIYRNDQFYEEQLTQAPPRDLKTFRSGASIPKPSLINPQNYDPNSHDVVDGDALVPEARRALIDVWDKVIVKCWSDDPLDRPSPRILLQILNEIKETALEIQGDTEVEALEKVVYDVCEENRQQNTKDTKMTVQELEQALLHKFPDKYLPSTCIRRFKTKLGEGHFGIVFEGEFRNPSKNQQEPLGPWKKVAIKTFRKPDGSSESDFIKEISITCDLDHPNIVKVSHFAKNSYIGSPDVKFYKFLLVMEFMTLGNLAVFSKKEWNSPGGPTPVNLLKIFIDVAEGMAYLSGLAIVHCDLAARNVLLTTVNNQIVAKVSDFGLARNMEDNYRFYRFKSNEVMPCYWMPPEVLDEYADSRPFSSQSDVWSFGVAMWEAFSKGTHPREYMPKSLSSILSWYRNNNRLPNCSFVCENVYEIMQKCWNFDYKDRPAFVKLVQNLKSLIGKKIVP